jgi:hypothetical protein
MKSLVFLILREDPNVRFTISNPMVFPKILPDVLSFLVPYSIDPFWFRPASYPEYSSFLGSWYSLVLALNLTTVSLTPCRNGMAGHPSAVGGQPLPGPTISILQKFPPRSLP